MKGSMYFAKLLKENGTTHVFYQDALLPQTIKDMNDIGITTIMAHSEIAAGYMADGYARATGKVGFCMAQSVGALNLAAGLHDAYLATSPVIAITGRKVPRLQYRNSYQETDHQKHFSGVTKFNALLEDPLQLPLLLRQCYREATIGKPRPVHLDLVHHMGLVVERADIEEPFVANPDFAVYPSARPAAAPDMVKKAADAISKADRPVILAGRGALVSGAGDEIIKLAEKADIPITTTPDGKSVIDENHPLWCGIVGLYGMYSANKLMYETDLVIVVGSQLSDQSTLDWTAPVSTTPVIQIDIAGEELGRSYPNCIGLLGDAKTVVGQLLEVVPEKKHPEWHARMRALIEDTLTRQNERYLSKAVPIDPARLCSELTKVLPDNAILISDTGWSAHWTASMVRVKPPQKYIRAAGTLGWAYPASLGAKCGFPDRPVISFVGDGAFWYFSNEMETARRYNIPTITIVNNNFGLAQEIAYTDRYYPGDRERSRRQTTYNATKILFGEVARAFGLHAVTVTDPEQIKPALEEALALNKPAIVEVITDQDTIGPLEVRDKDPKNPFKGHV